MKYLIPFYFILLISFVIIINVNLAKKPSKKTTKKPTKKTTKTTRATTTTKPRYVWRTLNANFYGTTVKRMGIEAVAFFNCIHPTMPKLNYISVKLGEKRGKRKKGNKQIKLAIKVLRFSGGNSSLENPLCHYLYSLFNVTATGIKYVIQQRQYNLNDRFACANESFSTLDAIKKLQ
ncbi:Hypothetical protein SRAE_2000499100 [Strongyloides ratti]|uniref:Uncharacterized protein n=1 Tax=Strongyloides ratti TaxID=34506 RepID=A0A090LKX1_STRRB|nr:Hypothetical protein SRAE_2000499100 [Strongyloides ratti]CEF70358.1 Hypothetical protein SRAE_2000499100 [Strongyloides ratti]